MRVTAVAGQMRKGLGHEGRAIAVILGNGLDHIFEEHMAIGGDQRVGIIPVHFELAVGILVIVLIRVPAEFQHRVADLTDHRKAPHQRLLIVAGLALVVGRVRHAAAVGAGQKILALDAALHAVAELGGVFDLAFQHYARRGLHLRAVHPQVGGQPAYFAIPWQLDQAGGIGAAKHVGMRRCHVQPHREAGKAGAVSLHLLYRAGRYQLGAQHAEQIDEADEEIFDALGFRGLRQIGCHGLPPLRAIVERSVEGAGSGS